MSIPATCPHCDERYYLRDDLAEKMVRCRECGQTFLVTESPPNLEQVVAALPVPVEPIAKPAASIPSPRQGKKLRPPDDEPRPRVVLTLVLGGIGFLAIVLMTVAVLPPFGSFKPLSPAAPRRPLVAQVPPWRMPPMDIPLNGDEPLHQENNKIVFPGAGNVIVFPDAPLPGGWGDIPQKPFQVDRAAVLVPLDLSAQVNWKRDEPIQFEGNHFGDLPKGETTLVGIKFRLQNGVIHLGGNPLAGERPLHARDIPVKSKFKRLYAFHTAQYTVNLGTRVGAYQVNYQDGTQEKFPLLYGEDVSDWWFDFQPTVERSRVGWVGRNDTNSIRFTVTRFDNPHPDKLVNSLDLVSADAGSCLCCAALTLEQ